MKNSHCLVLISLFLSSITFAGDNPDFTYLEPEGVALPKASFGLGVVIEPGFRLAFLTGRTGSDEDGSYSGDFAIQAKNALASVASLLKEAGMSWQDVVKINVYLTDRRDLPVWATIRDNTMGASRPAGTGVIVKELAAPQARIEITVIAAQRVE